MKDGSKNFWRFSVRNKWRKYLKKLNPFYPAKEIHRLKYLATHDQLTGLYNRRFFNEFLDGALKSAKKEDCHITLFLCDIKNFKCFNDTYGYLSGDKILKETAAILRDNIDDKDIAVRLGGDEFAVVFADKDVVSTSHASVHASVGRASRPPNKIESIRHKINSKTVIGYGGKQITNIQISEGTATFPQDGDTIEKLIDCADKSRRQDSSQNRSM